jgi:hypothetical protein
MHRHPRRPAATRGDCFSARLVLVLGLVLLGRPLRAAADAQVEPPSAAKAPVSQTDREARATTIAHALFDEGLRHVDAGRWDEARDRFERVLTLRYSAVAAYNLGLADVRLGRGVFAAATLRKLLGDPALDPKVRESATALLAEVESHFAWLTVRVLGACDGCSVYLDEEEWPWAATGVSVPIDPGSYRLQVRWGQSGLAEDRIEVASAAHVEADLAVRPGVLAAARSGQFANAPKSNPASSQPTAADMPGQGSILASGWFWGAIGVLTAGAVSAIALDRR